MTVPQIFARRNESDLGYKPLQVIKRRIEALIEREYLERDPEQPNAYRYLA